ncbi:conserved exported hypothetical protein [metagenome]|uniref:SGNH hydrolase-type esterase domain-containing protein n=1 Tax=metagenome TaxID=256318 RepID=A0A2P2C1B9_9ZZZZ
MVLRGVASPSSPWSLPRRALVIGVLGVVAMAAVLVLNLADRAGAGAAERCSRFTADSADRADQVAGRGRRIVVIGDSWSVGLGLERPEGSWPSRLSGAVRVAGFSGSGFSAHASTCGPVSFADRATAALRGGADLVVIEGGLNDVDQTDAEIQAGFVSLARSLEGERVLVVGPASAPARGAAVSRVDALLAKLAVRHHFSYLRTTGLALPYLDDRLHLTQAGHQQFGDFVAAQIAARAL